VDVVSECFDPGRESFGVGEHSAVAVPRLRHPTVVDTHQLVARCLVAVTHEALRHLLEQLFPDAVVWVALAVDVTPETLPREPPHWRGGREAVA